MFRSFTVVVVVLCHGRMGHALPASGQVLKSGQPEVTSVSDEVANGEGRSGTVSPAAVYDIEDGDAPENLPSNPSADEVSGSSPEAGLDDAFLSRKKRLVNPSLEFVQDGFPEQLDFGSKTQVPYHFPEADFWSKPQFPYHFQEADFGPRPQVPYHSPEADFGQEPQVPYHFPEADFGPKPQFPNHFPEADFGPRPQLPDHFPEADFVPKPQVPYDLAEADLGPKQQVPYDFPEADLGPNPQDTYYFVEADSWPKPQAPYQRNMVLTTHPNMVHPPQYNAPFANLPFDESGMQQHGAVEMPNVALDRPNLSAAMMPYA